VEFITENFIVEYLDEKNMICFVSTNLKTRIRLKGKHPRNTGIAIKAVGYYNDGKDTFYCEKWAYDKIPQEDVFIAYAKTFKGIGTVKAKKILKENGVDYSVFSDEEKIKKYCRKEYEAIVKKAKKDDDFLFDTKLLKLIASFGVLPLAKIQKICSAITYDDFIKNPFVVTRKGLGASYKSCNSMVLQMQDKHPKLLCLDDRIAGAIEYTLRMGLSRGHTYMSAENLVSDTLRFLNNGVNKKQNYVAEKDVKNHLNLLNKQHKIKAEKSATELRIYNAFYYDSEKFIAQELHRKITSSFRKIPQEKIVAELDKFDATSKFKLADSQRLAIETIVNNQVVVITGSAGTGKTTVLKAAIQTLEHLGKTKIVLAAPTGRAARRMAEATEHEASTLHSLLHLGVEDEETDAMDVYMDETKLDADAIFVDETSMCDIGIVYRLFQKIPESCRVYFIGDPHQLESVGSGSVLSDMIDSYCVPVVKLKFIYRQAKDSNIIMNADRILKGKQNLTVGKDFEIIDLKDVSEIEKRVASIYVDELKRNSLLDVQCICPMRKSGALATNQLNKVVQRAVNSNVKSNSFFKANNFCFYTGDKIICGKNTKTIRNGDIGIVLSSTPSLLKCDFEGTEEAFSVEDAINLGISLAYCITVHKAQGSEFVTTIMPVAEENESMLKRNLFYTAVTRAKKKMILVGDKTEISKAIFNNKTMKRNGMLKYRIQKEFY